MLRKAPWSSSSRSLVLSRVPVRMNSTSFQTTRSAKIIDGSVISRLVREEVRNEIQRIKKNDEKLNVILAVILVGDRKESKTYVNMKVKGCEDVGIGNKQFYLSENVTQKEIEDIIDNLNQDKEVNGILIQLPLPKHINTEAIINRVRSEKDVDGLTLRNVGALTKYGEKSELIACTPLGCIELLDRSDVKLEGKHCVVIGRSELVGKPLSLLLLSRSATVTICHSKTNDLPFICKNADVLVSAVGKAKFIKGSWIKPGAVVLDVGTTAVSDPTKKSGFKLVGDVEFDEAIKIASMITPVPGGVGPMTVAMLLRNTVRAFKWQHKL